MEHFEKICINCPAGCHLSITRDGNGQISVTGNRCPRGAAYAQTELTDPRRTVTAAIPVAAGHTAGCLPVKSTAPVPVKMIPELLKRLYATKVTLPVRIGDVILSDAGAPGINVIATRSVE